jgi:hypothetical protein
MNLLRNYITCTQYAKGGRLSSEFECSTTAVAAVAGAAADENGTLIYLSASVIGVSPLSGRKNRALLGSGSSLFLVRIRNIPWNIKDLTRVNPARVFDLIAVGAIDKGPEHAIGIDEWLACNGIEVFANLYSVVPDVCRRLGRVRRNLFR